LQLDDLTLEVPRHRPLTQSFEAAYLGLHKAASVKAKPDPKL
jgi:hypothetical protein